MARTEQPLQVAGWANESLELRIEVGRDGMARLTRLAAPCAKPLSRDAALPLLDVIVTGEGRGWSGGRYCESEAGGRFRYAGHSERAAGAAGPWRELRVDLDDPVTGLRAEVFYLIMDAGGAAGGVRTWVRLENRAQRPVTIESATSFLFGGLGTCRDPDDLADLDLLWAENDWMAEGRWQQRPLRGALPDLDRRSLGADPRGCFSLTSAGTWSTGRYLPVGALVNRRTGHAWAWQIEHNGGWHWQVGECTHRSAGSDPGPNRRHAPAGAAVSGAYLALLGPAYAEHHWQVTLNPGDAFSTVPASIAVSPEGFDGAMAGLTAIRRAIRRPHEDARRLPVIFNDYMNTLMSNPTTERLLPLIDAAAQAGAEYFCIDAGWYAEIDENWWGTVGAWRPSPTRFPGGLAAVLDRIRELGMVPGLWLEPEVVGVGSDVARQLPADAFFRRGGQLIVEHGRYHLDLRHPAAVKHLDQAVDYLVGELGVGYLKFDYNIAVGPGPETGGLSAGAGLLAANRAHLDWLDAVLDRHPGLVIENCSSGGMRTDYALLSRMQLQSTSDQQEFIRYPPIAAAAPAAITPEQGAVWAYPQPEFTDDEIAFTMASALLGRIHLSGHLDRMSGRQRALVAEAVQVYKRDIRNAIAQSAPFWPLGLPGWDAPWVALGLRAPRVTHLTIWRRGPRQGTDTGQITLAVPHLRGAPVSATVLYPREAGAEASWDPSPGMLAVTLPRVPSACVVRMAPA